MFSNQTSRVYCDLGDLDGGVRVLHRQASELMDAGRTDEAWECMGAALALTIIATTPCKTQADFMANFMARLLDEPQKANAWEVCHE